jgi:hypothetical protein
VRLTAAQSCSRSLSTSPNGLTNSTKLIKHQKKKDLRPPIGIYKAQWRAFTATVQPNFRCF